MGTSNIPPKQEETAEVIYKLTQDFNYPPTLDEIAAEMGITKGTLQYHMTALRKKNIITWNPGAARSVRIINSEVFSHCENKFPRKTHSRPSIMAKPYDNEFKLEQAKTKIPILGNIAAGLPLHILDKSEEYLELDSYFPEGCYALKVKGESMVDALISDGDLVLVEPRHSANNGEIVVALLDNESTTLKRFFKETDGQIRLQPENPTMEAIIVPREQALSIQGIVKGVIRKV
jgi:repressor LexA